MVIGKGLLGTELNNIDQDDVVFFASGVSDSKSTNSADFNREMDLLKQSMESTHQLFVYFSTCSIDNPDVQNSMYVQFKTKVEDYIKENRENYLIVRTSNLVGKGGNMKTVINYFADHIIHNTQFDVWENAYRNVLDVVLLSKMLQYYIQYYNVNCTITLCNTKDTKVIDIIKILEEILSKKANYKTLNKGVFFPIDHRLSLELSHQLNLENEMDIKNTLAKYY